MSAMANNWLHTAYRPLIVGEEIANSSPEASATAHGGGVSRVCHVVAASCLWRCMGGAAHVHPMNQPDLSEQCKAKPNNDASLGNTRRRGLSAASLNMKHVAAQHDNESRRFPHGGCAQYPQDAPEDIGGQANWVPTASARNVTVTHLASVSVAVADFVGGLGGRRSQPGSYRWRSKP
jgi:hypothetical protein